jgi:serine/threonine protein phosphatase 1
MVLSTNHYRRLVISDIHGCAKTLMALVESKVQLTKDDHLYLLGDYIDRGPNSSGVIDYLINLTNNGYNIFPIRGNHEQNLLNAINEYDTETLVHFVRIINNSGDLLDENNTIKQRYIDFFTSLKFYYDLGDFIIVHAGINFSSPNPLSDTLAMLELRNTVPNHKLLNGRAIVHGHQVTHLNDIFSAIERKSTLLPLDNGCSYTKPHKIYDYKQLGNLCCLNLDTYELYLQRNIDE